MAHRKPPEKTPSNAATTRSNDAGERTDAAPAESKEELARMSERLKTLRRERQKPKQ